MSEKELLDIIKREIEKYIGEKNTFKGQTIKEKITLLGEDLIIRKEIEKKFELSDESAKVLILS